MHAPLFDLPSELTLDTELARGEIESFIRAQLAAAGLERLVLGLSGGIDSALVAHLAAGAIGAENLLCIRLPYRTSSPESLADAASVIERLGCPSETVEISAMVDAYFGADGSGGAGGPASADASPVRRGNFAARMRMSVLYDRSAQWRGLVAGTGNRTESLIGYTTLYGDSASAFNPIAGLYKSQVRQLSAALGVPEAILRKAPSADLWPGQTDEGEAGFSYPELDRMLYRIVDLERSDDELAAEGFAREAVARLRGMIAGSEFKRRLAPSVVLSKRAFPGRA